MRSVRRLLLGYLAALGLLAWAAAPTAADVSAATVTLGSATAGAATTYDVAFSVGAAGALSAGVDTITVQLPAQTGVPNLAAADIRVQDTTAATAGTVALAPTVSGTTVTFTTPINIGGGDAVVVSFLDNGAGHVLTNPTAAGPYTLAVYTAAETNPVTASAYTISPGAVTHFSVTTQHSGSETAGLVFSVTLTARDSYENTVSSYAGSHNITWTWTATGSPNSTAPTRPADGNRTFGGGALTLNGFALTNAGEAPTISAGDGSVSGTSAPITVSPGLAGSFGLATQHAGTETAGAPFSVTLTAQDAYGNTDTSYAGAHAISWTWTASNSPNNTPPVKPADGNQSFTAGTVTVAGFVLTRAGQTPTITAGDGSISGSTAGITVGPGPAAGFGVATQHGGSETAGSVFSVTLTALDAQGNTATGYAGSYPITWTWTATNSPNNTPPSKPANGSQTFAGGAATVGGFTLTNAGETPTIAASDGAVSGSTAAIAVSPGPATGFSVATQHGGTETAGSAFSVTLTATDAAGNTVAGYTGAHAITWSWTATASPNSTAPNKPADGNQSFAAGTVTTLGFTLTNAGQAPTITASDGAISGSSAAVTVSPGAPATFAVATQHGGSETAGTAFSVTLAAVDALGNTATAYAGSHSITWTWNATASPNSTPPSKPADGNQGFTSGAATTLGFTLTNAGETPTLTASDGTLSGSSAVTVGPGAAASFSVATQHGGSETAGSAFSVTLTARDALGNTATGYSGSHSLTWTWTATASPNSTPPGKPADGNQTFTAGTVSVTGFTLTNAGQTPTITASDGAVSGSTAGVTVSPGPAARFSVATQHGGSETAGSAFSVTLTALDAAGNSATGYTGSHSLTWTWTATNSPNNAAPTRPPNGNQTFTAGAATVPGFTLTNAGQAPTITASDGTVSGSSAAVTVSPGATAAFAVTTQHGGIEAATSAFSVTVTARDALGNTATGYTGTHSLTWTWTATAVPGGSAPTRAPDGSASFSAGAATVSGFTLANASESPTITASDGSSSGTSAPIAVNAGPARSLQLTVGAGSVVAGTSFSVTVRARDGAGNTAPGYAGTVHFTSSDQSATLPANYTFLGADAGQHAFNVTLFTSGTQTIDVTDAGNAVSGAAGSITVAARPPVRITQITVSGPAQVAAGQAVAYTATAMGSDGLSIALGFNWSASGGSISAGLWTAPTRPGVYTVSAASGSVTGTLSVTVTHGPVATLSLSPSGPTTVQAGTPLALTLHAADSFGNPIADAGPAWGVTGPGSVSNGSFRSTVIGMATVTVTLAGKSATSGPITIAPGAPAAVRVLPATARLSAGGTATFSATVLDAYGNAVTGAPVTWAATGGTVDSGGHFTAGSGAGGTVTASAGTASGSATVTIAAAPDGGGDGSPGGIRAGDAAVTSSTQPTPASARVLLGPAVIGGSGTAAVHFILPDGSAPDAALLAYYYDSALAAWIAVPTHRIADGLAAELPAGLPVALMRTAVRQLTDTGEHWANAYVLKLQSLGLIGGMPDGGFHPDEAVNRYQVAKVLALAAGLDAARADLTLLDRLPDGADIPDWARPYVAAVLASGLMNGTGNGFEGEAVVTRAQMATLLGRLLAGGPEADLTFADSDAIPVWARAGVARAVAAGIIKGFPDGGFHPGDPLTRAQMAKIMALIIDAKASGR